MKKIVIIFFVSYGLSQQIQFIPFDWSGQFGYVNKNGAIMWNQDWQSGRLLFDGTWSVYPKMYGNEIEEGFLSQSADTSNFDSSLVKSIQLVKDGEAQAAVSAGNTGALLTSSLFLIGKIPGIRRPAFAPFIPTNNGGFILCDAGANADSKPQHLVQFALMASAYIEHLKNRPNPKVALLNIGREENKGNELMSNAYPMLKTHVRNFIGNIESRYILEGKADVVICDGFTGNIVLKLTEGIISHLMGWIQERIKVHSADNDISSIITPVFTDIKNTLDHEEHGATPLLGINGVVMKCHGSSSERGIKNSIIAAQKTVEGKLIDGIADRLSRHSDIFDEDIAISETNPV